MVKVAMITGSFPPDKCGVGDYTKILSKNISEKDIDVHVITSCQNISLNEKYKIYNEIDNWSFKSIKTIIAYIKKIKPDIVHIQYPTKAYGRKTMINIIPMILKVKGYKVITTLHEYSDNSTLGKIRANVNIMFSDLIIVVDKRYKNDIVKSCFFKSKKVEYVNIASNIPKSIINYDDRKKIRNNILKYNNKKIMAYFGFVHEGKGIESILESMKTLKDKENLNVKFLIIAEINEFNEYHKKLLTLINELELSEDIIITGYLKDYEVANYLNASDFVVLPFKDGFSPKNGSVLAALQEGKQVITTKSKYLKESFDNLIFIDKYDSIDQLIDIIEKKQTENQNFLVEESDIFNWNYVTNKHIDIYKLNNK